MVQNKQKSNKINITALITCFMLIVVFVFGCVQFAFASDDLTLEQYVEKYPVQYYILTKSDHYNGTENGFYSSACDFEGTPNRICGYIVSDGTSNSEISFCSDTPWKNVYYWANGWGSWGGSARKNSDGIYKFGSSTAIKKVNEYLTNVVLFSNYEDAKTYILTGQINNPMFEPSGSYDENIPTPANISLTFNCEFGDSFKLEEIGHPFTMTWDNVQSSDNQINYDDLTFECYVDMGYWAYKDIFGHHDNKTTGKIKLFDSSAMSKYKTCDKLGKNSDWDTWFSNVKLDIKAFGMLGQYYDFYCRYVDSSGNYGNWVKIHVSGSNSTINRKWGVIKDIDASTTVNKGYEEINGDSGEHVSGDYDNYYVGTPDGNLSNNLTSLKSNYSNLVSFYKELFSFLPAEIWIILIGLVSTMVVIAIIKFVRG